MFFLAASGFVASAFDRRTCLDLLEPYLLAGDLFFFRRHGVAGDNVVVVNTTMAATRALMAAVAAPAAAALAAGNGRVIMILMMTLMLLTIVRLLVARICAAFFPRVLARFVDFAVSLVREIKLWLVFAAVVSPVVSAVVPAVGLLVAAA